MNPIEPLVQMLDVNPNMPGTQQSVPVLTEGQIVMLTRCNGHLTAVMKPFTDTETLSAVDAKNAENSAKKARIEKFVDTVLARQLATAEIIEDPDEQERRIERLTQQQQRYADDLAFRTTVNAKIESSRWAKLNPVLSAAGLTVSILVVSKAFADVEDASANAAVTPIA